MNAKESSLFNLNHADVDGRRIIAMNCARPWSMRFTRLWSDRWRPPQYFLLNLVDPPTCRSLFKEMQNNFLDLKMHSKESSKSFALQN